MPKVISDDDSGIVRVIDNSPKYHRIAVERISRFFMKEMKYSFLQYDSNDPSFESSATPIPTISFLFTEPHHGHSLKSGKMQILTKGAICFRKRKYEIFPKPYWEVDWVWLHPYERGEKVLDRYWDSFVDEFELIFPSVPISKSFEKFLEKRNAPISPLKYFEVS